MTPPRILKYPDSRLRRVAKPVTDFSVVPAIVGEMLALMRKDGIGLAAPQVGLDLRLLVVCLTKKPEPEDVLVLVNPEIIKQEGKCLYEEGCLSLPGIFAEVERPKRIVVRAQGLDGEAISLEAEGLKARCILHEIDHLSGILFVDRLSPAKKLKIKKQLEELENGPDRTP